MEEGYLPGDLGPGKHIIHFATTCCQICAKFSVALNGEQQLYRVSFVELLHIYIIAIRSTCKLESSSVLITQRKSNLMDQKLC